MSDILKPVFKIKISGFSYLGRGPKATGINNGWLRDDNLYFRCVKCGSLLKSIYNAYWHCRCGAIHLDSDAGRFGSNYGDDNILVYKTTNKAGLKSYFRKILRSKENVVQSGDNFLFLSKQLYLESIHPFDFRYSESQEYQKLIDLGIT